jgi:hypothetical protein
VLKPCDAANKRPTSLGFHVTSLISDVGSTKCQSSRSAVAVARWWSQRRSVEHARDGLTSAKTGKQAATNLKAGAQG